MIFFRGDDLVKSQPHYGQPVISSISQEQNLLTQDRLVMGGKHRLAGNNDSQQMYIKRTAF